MAAPAPAPDGDAPVAALAPLPAIIDCGPAIPGSEEVLTPGTVLMMGEFHGTAQIPAFVGALLCHAAEAGHPVRLGLEIKAGEQAALDRYMAGDGGDGARAALLAAPHWNRADQDGRSSEAILALIETARQLRAAGRDVAVFAYDADAHSDWNDRDQQMAAVILAHAQQAPEGVVVTLSGNLHNRTVPGLKWDADAVPMGVHVKAGHPRTISLQPGYTGGSAWVCTSAGCGPLDIGGRPEYGARSIAMTTDAPEQDGVFAVGAVTASPPAVTASPPADGASPPAAGAPATE